jgi:apolipoprotein D and lipocalin family protein
MNARGVSPPESGDLDELIAAAERAVVARDRRVRDALRDVGSRLRQRSVGIALSAVWAVLAVLLWRRGHGDRQVLRGKGLRLGSVLRSASALLGGEIGKVFPAGLPRFFAGLVAPFLARFFAARPAAVPDSGTRSEGDEATIDLSRFLGRWYEVARLPCAAEERCASDVTATYERDPRDAEDTLRVVAECLGRNGRWRTRRGIARVVPGYANTRLEVSFAAALLRFLPAFWSEWRILFVDAEYTLALVGTADRRHLWLLSRSPVPAAAQMALLSERAQAMGYATGELSRTPHGSP